MILIKKINNVIRNKLMKYLNKIIREVANKIIKNKILIFRIFNILFLLLATVIMIKLQYNECSDLHNYLCFVFLIYGILIAFQSFKKKVDILVIFLINILCISVVFTVILCTKNICSYNIILKIILFPIFSSIMTLIFQYLSYERYRKNIELIGFYSFPLKNISILDVVFSVIYGLWIILWITVIAKL